MHLCEVCNNNEPVGICSGASGPVSYAICKECLALGAEPYGYLVAYISGAGDANMTKDCIAPEYYAVIERTCERAGKTEEEFWRDVRKAAAEYDAYCSRQEEDP